MLRCAPERPIVGGVRGEVLIGRRIAAGFAVAFAVCMVVYPALPAGTQPFAYFLINLSAAVPCALGVRWTPRGYRGPGIVLLAAILVLTVGNALAAIDGLHGPSRGPLCRAALAIGHVLCLLAALQMVRQRGRKDVGGIIDTTVVGIGLAGLLWTTALEPRLAAGGAGMSSQASLLVIILALAGILGALVRLEVLSRSFRREPLPALRLLMLALVNGMVSNVALGLTDSLEMVHRPTWIQELFLISYLAMGAAAVHPSWRELVSPGPASEDRLSRSRLAFLGAALGVNPIIAGIQESLGRDVDALLLAIGTTAIVPLVLVRVGWLSWQRSLAEQALTYQATHDALTGLPNRTEFLARLTAAIDADTGSRRPLVLFCDLNGFKAVNDRLGHIAGDQLLHQAGERLASCVRAGDTLARYGGDEYVILCPTPTPDVTVEAIRQRIVAAFDAPFEAGGEAVRVGVSVGAVSATEDMDSTAILHLADEAMYSAKRNRDAATMVSFQMA
jgi:diguanylate cyclase (GGDEF)-like protein